MEKSSCMRLKYANERSEFIPGFVCCLILLW